MFDLLKSLFGKKDESAIIDAIKGGAFLVDVRSPAEFAGGSVPGATNIPLNNIERQLGKFKGKKAIVVFCQSGMRSAQAKRILDNNGVANVFNGGTWNRVKQLKAQK